MLLGARSFTPVVSFKVDMISPNHIIKSKCIYTTNLKKDCNSTNAGVVQNGNTSSSSSYQFTQINK